MKVLVIDSLIGNDYSLCLCDSLNKIGLSTVLVGTEDRKIKIPISFQFIPWAPPKRQGTNRGKKTIQYLCYLFRLFKYIIKDEADIFHFQFLRRERSESLYLLVLRMFNKNLVHTAHNVLPHENSKIDYIFKFILYKSSKIIIVHSEYIRKKLLRKFRITKKKIKVVPHGNFDIYRPKIMISKKEARQRFHLSERDNVLLFFGYIRKYKGLDLLLDSFDFASKINPKLKLIIAGSPRSHKLKNHYHQKIQSMKIADKIRYYPQFVPPDDIPAYFQASDVVMLPYKKIDHSGIVHLAYSFEKPVIATNVGDFEETIENGVSGFLVRKDDPYHMAEMIRVVFSDTEKLERMKIAIRQLNITEYSWENVAVRTKKIYEMLMVKNAKSNI